MPPQDRQVLLRAPDGRFLALGTDDVLTTAPVPAGATPFAFVPVSPESESHLVRTGWVGPSGEPFCLFGTGDGAEPGGGVAAAACDTSDPAQHFTVRPGPDGLVLGVGRGDVWVDTLLVSVTLDYEGTPLTALDAGPAAPGPG